MIEERTRKFINSVILLSKLFPQLDDAFFAGKLYQKISSFISAFIKSPHSNVAQYNDELSHTLNDLIDFLDNLQHVAKTNATPLLIAQRNLLKLKLYLTHEKKTESIVPDSQIKKQSAEIKHKPTPALPDIKINSNKERIIEFIRRTSRARTKDIIDELSALSERTVKRNLKELTQSGIIRKQAENRAMFYSLNN